jgi:hypothetical protein
MGLVAAGSSTARNDKLKDLGAIVEILDQAERLQKLSEKHLQALTGFHKLRAWTRRRISQAITRWVQAWRTNAEAHLPRMQELPRNIFQANRTANL